LRDSGRLDQAQPTFDAFHPLVEPIETGFETNEIRPQVGKVSPQACNLPLERGKPHCDFRLAFAKQPDVRADGAQVLQHQALTFIGHGAS
jgi:hypothetical protein